MNFYESEVLWIIVPRETEKTIQNLYFIFEEKVMSQFISNSRLYSHRSTICVIVNWSSRKSIGVSIKYHNKASIKPATYRTNNITNIQSTKDTIVLIKPKNNTTTCARNCDPHRLACPYSHAQLWGPQSLAHCVCNWVYHCTCKPFTHQIDCQPTFW